VYIFIILRILVGTIIKAPEPLTASRPAVKRELNNGRPPWR